MGVFRAFFGCRGVAGFNACCSGASIGDGGFTLACISGCRGVIGCIVATCLCPVREKVRPAWPDGGCKREKVRPASPKRPKNAVFRRVGRVFRGRADEGAVLGEVFRGPAVARERRRQAHKPPHLQGYDRGGTPKDPASRCVRWSCRQRQKLSARASARKQRPRSNQARTLSSSTSP